MARLDTFPTLNTFTTFNIVALACCRIIAPKSDISDQEISDQNQRSRRIIVYFWPMATDLQKNIDQLGFAVVENVYSGEEITALSETLANHANRSDATFRKTNDLFAIRQVMKEVPELLPLVFNERLRAVINETFGDDFFIVKSIYFDKPANSNWFVAYHQDLTISVDKRIRIEGFGPWTVKQNQFAVQPPQEILERNFTIRIHLDDTNEENGALRVLPQSHLKGIFRPETINLKEEKEITCSVNRGGIMLMKPLLMHASSRTTNEMRRRVIHIELSNVNLPDGLQWSEKSLIP